TESLSARKLCFRPRRAAKLPGDLSGMALVRHLCRHYDYRQVHQEGSHIVLETSVPRPHHLAVPNHPSLRVGTLNAIWRAVAAVKGI
ncbi:MAG: type II toxin-antitoxin system HicA family toxin, partial [Verrucomicrobiia bacterium]